MLKRGQLYPVQAAGGAAMGEYHGWETPLSYGPFLPEFTAAIYGAALFDATPFGRVTVTGADRLDLLHRLSTNDVGRCKPGDVTATLFLTDKGRIIDRVLLFVGENSLLLITSPGMESRLIGWIERYTITEDIQLFNITDSSIMLCVLGPETTSFFTHLTPPLIEPDRWAKASVGGVEGTVGLRHTSHGTTGFIVLERPDHLPSQYSINQFAQELGARIIGSTAYEAFRICQGIPFHGSELNDRFTPFEVGLREEISFTKGCYIGQEVIARLETYQKVRRGLAGVVLSDSGHVSPGDAIRRDNAEVGILTSVLPVPVKGTMAGLGVVSMAEAPVGESVQIGGDGARGIIAALPLQIAGRP